MVNGAQLRRRPPSSIGGMALDRKSHQPAKPHTPNQKVSMQMQVQFPTDLRQSQLLI